MVVDKNQIEKILHDYFQVKYGIIQIDDSGLINISHDPAVPGRYAEVALRVSLVDGALPVSFGTVEGSFDAAESNVKTLKGFPKIIHGHLYTEENKNLRQLYGFDIQRIDGMWYHTYRRSQGLLKMLVAKKIGLYAGENPSGVDSDEVMEIMNKYCGTGNPADVLRCASELAEHGYDENAEW